MPTPKQHLSIKDWEADDRPREKLLERGLEALTDAELLAILLGTGTQARSAVDLGRDLIKEFGGLQRLSRTTIQEMRRVKGIGPAKAIGIVSAFELARRSQLLDREDVVVSSSASLHAFVAPRIAHLQHEVFLVLFLNSRNKVLAEEIISVGGVKGTVVDPRLIFKSALAHLATGIILAHNHPSGALRPSHTDRTLTDTLAQGGRFLDVQVLDHLIVTTQGYFSFADEGLL